MKFSATGYSKKKKKNTKKQKTNKQKTNTLLNSQRIKLCLPLLDPYVFNLIILRCFIILAKSLSRAELQKLLDFPIGKCWSIRVLAAFDPSFSAGVCKGLLATQESGTFTVPEKYWVIIIIVEWLYSLLCRILALDFHFTPWTTARLSFTIPEFAQTQVHWIDDSIQPSHLLLPASPPAINLSQHQGLSQWVSSSTQVAKVLELQLQHQSF